jgi:anti-sigma-K factor RskA
MKKEIINKICAIVAVCVVVAFCMTVLPGKARATAPYTIRLTDSNGSNVVFAQAGDTVTLELSVINNPGIISVGAELRYPQQLSVSNAELTQQDMVDMIMQSNVSVQPTYSPLTNNPFTAWLNMATGTVDNKLVTYNGVISRITIIVADDAQPGDYTITLNAPEDKNMTAQVGGDGVILPDTNTEVTGITTINCTIRVTGNQGGQEGGGEADPAGDIDGNNQTNSDDVIMLLLHVTMPDQFPINAEADFTGDGEVTSDDVIMLLLHVTMPDQFPL